jgi:predicted DNA repair protein MutK
MCPLNGGANSNDVHFRAIDNNLETTRNKFMAGASLLVLLDDIAAVLDDVAAMTKVAAKKTAAVLGDDLAVNAEKVTGVRADRELPVVWAVAKGSFRNKCILVPAALAISAVASWLITPLLMLGGLYLCFEGFESLAHKLFHSTPAEDQHMEELSATLADPEGDMMAFEQEKIKGAIRTDMILSGEIIVITLGIVAESDFLSQVVVVAGIAFAMTIGVYGLVAGIVKLDDAGLYLTQTTGVSVWPRFLRWCGLRLLNFAPLLMKGLAVVGTIAMFMVGGGILVHGFHPIAVAVDQVAVQLGTMAFAGGAIQAITPSLLSTLFGVLAGSLAVGGLTLWKFIRR